MIEKALDGRLAFRPPIRQFHWDEVFVNSEFGKVSYLAQVRRLRTLAKVALDRFPVRVKEIRFIRHGENATFCAVAKDGQKYLLRLHRADYHSPAAIREELSWLSVLAQVRDLRVPEPVRSRAGKLVEQVTLPHSDLARNCCLFKWIEGQFLEKSIGTKQMFLVGETLARIQVHAPKSPVRHRRYWTADGLVGANAKFGSIDALPGLTPAQQKTITSARTQTLRNLQQFASRFPKRMGLIHADFHFGNIIACGSELAAIDFDDCGFGFFAYDLVIPLLSAEDRIGVARKRKLAELRNALFDGYTSLKEWDQNDEMIFPSLIAARKLAMLGWLNSRSDNPRLKKHFKSYLLDVLKFISTDFEP